MHHETVPFAAPQIDSASPNTNQAPHPAASIGGIAISSRDEIVDQHMVTEPMRSGRRLRENTW